MTNQVRHSLNNPPTRNLPKVKEVQETQFRAMAPQMNLTKIQDFEIIEIAERGKLIVDPSD